MSYPIYKDYIKQTDSQTLRDFLSSYQDWLEKQLMIGGLVFTPEDYYNFNWVYTNNRKDETNDNI